MVDPGGLSQRLPNVKWIWRAAYRPLRKKQYSKWSGMLIKRPACPNYAWLVAWRLIVWPTVEFCAKDRFRISGFSPPRVMPAGQSVSRWRFGIDTWGKSVSALREPESGMRLAVKAATGCHLISMA